ncbi:hypothetical protein [Falsiroseomonas stagni]|nr:hypothetical protein [Falsiroseomonas stagni]
MSARSEVVEVVTRGERRRAWAVEQKRLIVAEAMQPSATPTEVARRWGTRKPVKDDHPERKPITIYQ